jgi:hypothetical protein
METMDVDKEEEGTILYTERGTRRRVVKAMDIDQLFKILFKILRQGDVYVIHKNHDVFTYAIITWNDENIMTRRIIKTVTDSSMLQECKFIMAGNIKEDIEDPRYDNLTIVDVVNDAIYYSMSYLDNCKPAVRGEINNNSVPTDRIQDT